MTDAEQEAVTMDHWIWVLENERCSLSMAERKDIAGALREYKLLLTTAAASHTSTMEAKR